MEAPFSKRLMWRIEAWAHTAVTAIVGRLPPQTVFHFGEAVGKMIWPLMKGRQKTIARNLRIAGIVDGGASTDELAKRSFM